MEQQLYIIPINAAVPQVLSHLPMHKGTFATRVATAEAEGGLLPLSAAEVHALSKSPEVFELHAPIVITALPGGFYDPLFDASVARYGARSVPWPQLEAEFREANITAQRTKDKQPWLSKDEKVGEVLESKQKEFSDPDEDAE